MEELERRRRRALYRCHHRGTKEMDIVMGKYAESRIPLMESQELDLFEYLAIAESQKYRLNASFIGLLF